MSRLMGRVVAGNRRSRRRTIALGVASLAVVGAFGAATVNAFAQGSFILNVTVNNPDANAVSVTSVDGGTRSVNCVMLAADVAVPRSESYSIKAFGTADCIAGSELPEELSFDVLPISSRCVVSVGSPNSVSCDFVS